MGMFNLWMKWTSDKLLVLLLFLCTLCTANTTKTTKKFFILCVSNWDGCFSLPLYVREISLFIYLRLFTLTRHKQSKFMIFPTAFEGWPQVDWCIQNWMNFLNIETLLVQIKEWTGIWELMLLQNHSSEERRKKKFARELDRLDAFWIDNHQSSIIVRFMKKERRNKKYC